MCYGAKSHQIKIKTEGVQSSKSKHNSGRKRQHSIENIKATLASVNVEMKTRIVNKPGRIMESEQE